MGTAARERARVRIEELSRQGHDLVTFWAAVTDVLGTAVPYYWTPCYYTLDPASLLVTSHFHHGVEAIPAEWLASEYYDDDVNKLVDVVRSPDGIQTLHEVTGGDPSGTVRWQKNMELGGDQELIAALRTRSGEAWGALGLYREPGAPMFDRDEKAWLVSVTPALAAGARRALLYGEALDPDGPVSPGLVVLGADWEIESSTPGVERWLHDLPDGDWEAGVLPSSVQSVAGRALRTAERADVAGEVAIARVLGRSGTWIVLHGASLVADGRQRVAVIVEPAHPARIAPLLMAAYALTGREQEVTLRVLHGDSTTQIARALHLSPHTVQEHLKSVFEKTGVRSRRDLVGRVFFAWYEPRVRDNERRVPAERPLRGGPKTAPPGRADA